jgi:hypothetical protein
MVQTPCPCRPRNGSWRSCAAVRSWINLQFPPQWLSKGRLSRIKKPSGVRSLSRVPTEQPGIMVQRQFDLEICTPVATRLIFPERIPRGRRFHVTF